MGPGACKAHYEQKTENCRLWISGLCLCAALLCLNSCIACAFTGLESLHRPCVGPRVHRRLGHSMGRGPCLSLPASFTASSAVLFSHVLIPAEQMALDLSGPNFPLIRCFVKIRQTIKQYSDVLRKPFCV